MRRAMVGRLADLGLTHPAVLQAFERVERHRFVDSALAAQAYEDTSLPIGWGQTISKPSVVGRMLELLCAGRSLPLGRVLEIGTGCGYQAALFVPSVPRGLQHGAPAGAARERARTCGRCAFQTSI